MIDILGWLAYFLIGIGFILIGSKKRNGWLIKAAGDSIWCYLGIVLGMSSISIPEGISAIISIYFWWRWI